MEQDGSEQTMQGWSGCNVRWVHRKAGHQCIQTYLPAEMLAFEVFMWQKALRSKTSVEENKTVNHNCLKRFFN